jgi:hypothetical protein
MTLRQQLKREKTVRGRRWIVKMGKDNLIYEVKMIFEPKEYMLSKKPKIKIMYGDKDLLRLLNHDNEKRLNLYR